MTSFHAFLTSRLAQGAFTTEDTLASFLPLLRQTLQAHAAGLVAPLRGLDQLHVEGVQVWFEQARVIPFQQNQVRLQALQPAHGCDVEIVGRVQSSGDPQDAAGSLRNLDVASLHDQVTRPVFLPGYVAWEHKLDHHDPLTDTFSLGLILASLACGLDLASTPGIERFANHRRNLFQICPELHPVLAQAIVRMTELDRQRRAQDLEAVLSTLENYRDQDVDLEIDLAQAAQQNTDRSRDKQTVVLTKLRERLFEISRRNRLLHFRPTLQTVNLTLASIPLSFDIQNIRAGQVLYWNDSLAQRVTSGKPLSLNKHLNFTEALYLPSTLDRIVTEARRDRAEYGFAQLRLAICFLNWTNLKQQPVEHFHSPLALLPVELKKKKGIRDTYALQIVSTEAEINPVVRHQFQQLYDIDLPDRIDLAETTLDAFYQQLNQVITARQGEVSLTKIERPRIQLIHERARRRLDQYRRRARIAGRGIRSYLDLDYSYDPANYHPLGLKLFQTKVCPTPDRLRRIVEEQPPTRAFAMPDASPSEFPEKTFYAVESGAEANPYSWTFDLCNVTLANFKYRKMSLVRDYEAILDEQLSSPAFDATFSLDPAATTTAAATLVSLPEDRFDIVPCDPTQAAAIEQAQSAASFIIQGPPGTGKSQTITNLIASYVGRGQRVLFVCEKRAALDVVFARLKQCGLGELCCLIHDSQADKKEFVMNLKTSYESSLQLPEQTDSSARRKTARQSALAALEKQLGPLSRYSQSMKSVHDEAGIPTRLLIERLIHKSADGRHPPAPTALEKERLPSYAEFDSCRQQVGEFFDALGDIQADGILARHPLKQLSPRLCQADHPLETITTALESATAGLAHLQSLWQATGIEAAESSNLPQIGKLIDYATALRPLSESGQLALLNASSNRAQRLTKLRQRIDRERAALQQAGAATSHWRTKLPPYETVIALEQARRLEALSIAWLKPAWWRLRRTMRRSYDFAAHEVSPAWSHVLDALKLEQAHESELADLTKLVAGEFGFEGDVQSHIDRIHELRDELKRSPARLQAVHKRIMSSQNPGVIIQKMAGAGELHAVVVEELDGILDEHHDRSLLQLQQDLAAIADALDELPDFLACLSELAGTPDRLRWALRHLPLDAVQLEMAVGDRTLEQIYRSERSLGRFNFQTRRRQAERLERHYDELLAGNAQHLRDCIQQHFLSQIRLANKAATQLDRRQRDFKKRYNRGRRELEHEFSKSMRYKSIRDIVSGDSGEVAADLKPVWLMSPLSVSDTLPLEPDSFDVVIFDEASQITLEESVPSLFRARQAIVVGDQMQLPPTDFFSAKRVSEEESLEVDEEGELIRYDLDSNSFLNHAAQNLPSTMLGWHYRSRHESLISFSNWSFYDGRLLTVPEESLPPADLAPIVVDANDPGEANAEEVLRRALSFHHLRGSVYEKRRNRHEAEYIAELLRELLKRRAGLSIGIVAFSEAQQDEIESAIARLGQRDAEFQSLVDEESEREVEGQFVGLLVKNLENIQGDERDIVILSVCYGYGPQGKMRMQFGPINKGGGEKRLNVAFSRARQHMAIVSSIEHHDITNDYNQGAACLKHYLQYAAAISAGDGRAAVGVLRSATLAQPAPNLPRDDSALGRQIALAFEAAGYQVEQAIGQSQFRCDLAVRPPGETKYRLGILLDDASYYDQSDILERDMMRPRLLREFGWRIAFVFGKDWYHDRDAVMKRLLAEAEFVE